MSLKKLAAIATIVTAIIAALQYMSPRNTSPEIPDAIKQDKNKLNIDVDKEIYSGELNWLLSMYKAANEIPYTSSKSAALSKVVTASLEVKDYNMAIIAASKIPYSSSKSSALIEIVESAVEDRDYFGYAYAAAEKIPYKSTKTYALNLIIEKSAVVLQKQKVNKSTIKQEISENKEIVKPAFNNTN